MSERRRSRPRPPDPEVNPNAGAFSTRITPRNSNGEEGIADADVKETPWRTLNQLANISRPTTPLRRASSAGPPSTRRSARRTPAGQTRTPGAQKLGGSARKPIAVTPHGRAAQRELDLRRAGLTPGKDRRRSGRQQRETPQNFLRALSRHLAPKSKPIVHTPEGSNAAGAKLNLGGNDDLDDGQVPERPRFSLPLGGDDDDDEDESLLLPPRSAGLEDENFTIQSVELARRAISEQPLGRLSRGSFGSIRMSDVNDSELRGLGGDAYDSSYLNGGGMGEDEILDIGDGAFQGENTGTLRGLGFSGRNSLSQGRGSDIRAVELPGDDTETTFVLTVPERHLSEEMDALDSQVVEYASGSMITDNWNDRNLEEDDGLSEQLSGRSSPEGLEGGVSLQETAVQDADHAGLEKGKTVRRRQLKVSRHGIQYPSLPAGVVKKLATTYARTAGNSKAKINKETLEAIMQASDWFFEQVSDDLGAYARHARRKTIDESDIVTLMSRQRQTNAAMTPFSLAQKYLPRELLQELRMVPPSKSKKGRQLERIGEADED